MTNISDRFHSVVLGSAIGDALGVPVEFCERGTFQVSDMIGNGTHNQPPGTWSDDTSLMLCLVDAMASNNRYTATLEKTAENFCRWYERGDFTARGEVFDIGISTLRAIKRLQAGSEPFESGCRGIDENGNGALMRIAPLVFIVPDGRSVYRYQIISWFSAITHAHPISTVSCIIYVDYLTKLLRGIDKFDALGAVQEEIRDAFTREEFYAYFPNEVIGYFMPLIVPGNKWQLREEGSIKSGGFVADTLKASIWCFLTTENYRDAVLKAVNLGGDTDTTATVTGALAGVYYGFGENGIPQEWVEKLARVDYIKGLCQKYIDSLS